MAYTIPSGITKGTILLCIAPADDYGLKEGHTYEVTTGGTGSLCMFTGPFFEKEQIDLNTIRNDVWENCLKIEGV